MFGVVVDVDARVQKDPGLVLLELFELELNHVGVEDLLLVVLPYGDYHQLHFNFLHKPEELFVLVLVYLGKVVENYQRRYLLLFADVAIPFLKENVELLVKILQQVALILLINHLAVDHINPVPEYLPRQEKKSYLDHQSSFPDS